VSLTAQAKAANENWPFVRFDDYQVQGMMLNQITGVSTLTIHPFVRDEDRNGWEIFSSFSQDWISDAHSYDQHVHPRLYTREFFNTSDGDEDQEEPPAFHWSSNGILPSLWTPDSEGNPVVLPENASELYAPVWQEAPAPDYSPNTNQDMLSNDKFKGAIKAIMKKKRLS